MPTSRIRKRVQPARAILKKRRVYMREVAEEMGYGTVNNVAQQLLGHRPPSRNLQDALVRLLGLPKSDLFWPEDVK